MAVDILVKEEVEMVDTMASEEMVLEGTFMDGTGAPPQVIQLVIRIGKFIAGLFLV